MRQRMRLHGRFKPLFYTVFWILFLSGALWLIVDFFDPNKTHSGLATGLMKSHGAAAMASLIVLGWLIPTHIQLGWHHKKNRVTGAIIVGIISMLVASGYGLYYFGDESLRDICIWVHCLLGLLFPIALVWHIWKGRKKRNLGIIGTKS